MKVARTSKRQVFSFTVPEKLKSWTELERSGEPSGTLKNCRKKSHNAEKTGDLLASPDFVYYAEKTEELPI